MTENSNKLSSVDDYSCPSCGADLAYDPKSGKLVCDHCGNSESISSVSTNHERDFFSGVSEDNFWQEEAISYECESCGAVTVMNKGEIAGHCPFCGSVKVISVKDQAGIKPTAVIPFAFDKKDAEAYYRKWIKNKLFAPSKVKKNFEPNSVNNIYVPCWTYDTVSASSYYGRVGKYYTVVVGSGKKRRTERRIRWYTVSGSYDRSFDDLAIEASSFIDQQRFEKIMPYDTNHAYDYDGRYLAGARAERYRVGIADAFDIAKVKMHSVIKSEIISKHNADVVDYMNVNVTYKEVRYKYVLLPLWVCSFAYNKKKYDFFVNGQTGKTSGKAPVSPWRVLVAVLLGLSAVALIFWLIASGNA